MGQRDRAERAGSIATARELAAAANANLEVDPERSILLALAAVEQSRSDDDDSALPEAEEALHRAVTASRIELRVPDVGGHLDWSPDGTVFVTEGPENSGIVDIRDAQTGESVRSFRGHDGDITDVAFNHDGTLLATTGTDATARIWNPATGDSCTPSGCPSPTVHGPPRARRSAATARSSPPHGPRTGLSRSSTSHPGGSSGRSARSRTPNDTTFDPAGARLAIASSSAPTAAVVDVASGKDVFALTGHVLYPIMDIAWSPDGESIATAGFDGSARVYDARTGRQRFAILNSGSVHSLDWSPDATRLVSGNGDGTARVWLLTDGGARELITLSAQDTRNGITGVAFSPDGTRVLTGDAGITAAQVWDASITGGAELANLPAVALTNGAVDFTSDGRQLVASSAAGSVTVWDAQSFTRLRTLGGAPSGSSSTPPVASGADVFALDVSPDGRLVAVARWDGTVRVWDMQTGRDAFTVDPGPTMAPYMDLTWSPDGDLLAVAAADGRTGRATIFDRSGRRLAVWQE